MWVLIDEGKCVELRDEIQVFEWDLLVCHGGWRNWRSEW